MQAMLRDEMRVQENKLKTAIATQTRRNQPSTRADRTLPDWACTSDTSGAWTAISQLTQPT